MKKLLLLFAAGAVAFSASAQHLTKSSPVFGAKAPIAKTPVDEGRKLVKPAQSTTKNPANKTTANPRWYSYFDEINAWNSQALENNLSVIPMWFDTTIQQIFTSGPGNINYSSTSLFIDPVRFLLYNEPTIHPGEMAITPTNAYTVDSVAFFAVYEQSMKRPNTVVDTLIVSVAPSTGRYSINKNGANNTWAGAYLPQGKDTLYAFTIFNVDSVNRAANSDVTGTNRIMWKVPLTASMRDTGFNIKRFAFKVPGGLNVPANNAFSVTATFKSGDTWTKNVDTINNFHRWMLLTGSTGTSAQMPYYYYDLNDRNMSNMMFSFDTSSYYPGVLIEGWNTTAFRYEFHNIDAYILCPTCPTTTTISVNDVSGISDVRAYPNPANDNITVSYGLKNTAAATVTITNAVGQVLAAEKTNNGKAVFSTANLSNGIYFYTVESNGQKVTNRFVVAH